MANRIALFEELTQGKTVLYAACGGIWTMLMFAPPTTEDMKLSRGALTAMRQKVPDGFATLTWVLPSAGFSMEKEAREAAASITDEYSSSILAQATFIEGTGFQAAAVRAIIAGIDLMTRSKAPKKVFAELGPSVRFCAEHCAHTRTNFKAADVELALSQARAKYP